ncbi:MAG: hypothetical protein B6U88_02245 [Candidatus Aenigmarchaeota archaeon ex4484_56]|nr:MAG: hypothetical protein B6U88_02245 [Candidatus Aenigmarchaeota archaeon ex4484_56]
MKEKDLRNFSLLCSILGLLVLFFASKKLESVVTKISDLTFNDIGKRVKVCGNITSYYLSKKNHLFLGLEDSTDSIDIVIFNSTISKLNLDPHILNKNQEICVLGTLTEYKSGLEIIADNVELC